MRGSKQSFSGNLPWFRAPKTQVKSIPKNSISTRVLRITTLSKQDVDEYRILHLTDLSTSPNQSAAVLHGNEIRATRRNVVDLMMGFMLKNNGPTVHEHGGPNFFPS